MVYAGGAINSGIRLAELQKQRSENAVQITRNQMRFIALGQYLELMKLNNGIKVYDSNITLTAKLIDDIKSRQNQGMALKNDVTRYELQMESLRLGKRRLEDQKSIANHQLCNTLGLTDVSIQPDMNLEAIGDNLDSELLLQTEAANLSPVLQQSAIDVKMAEQQLKLSKSELLPKIAVVAADNFAGPFTYDIPPIDKNFNIWYIGVGVKYSQQAYTMHKQSFVELRTQQKSVELAQQNYQVVSNRYQNQLALITDMIDASNIKLNAELQEVNARINIAYTYYNVRYAAGNI